MDLFRSNKERVFFWRSIKISDCTGWFFVVDNVYLKNTLYWEFRFGVGVVILFRFFFPNNSTIKRHTVTYLNWIGGFKKELLVFSMAVDCFFIRWCDKSVILRSNLIKRKYNFVTPRDTLIFNLDFFITVQKRIFKSYHTIAITYISLHLGRKLMM